MTRDQQILSLVPVARQFSRSIARAKNLDRDDAESEAMLAIIVAVDTFDPSRGASLQTHAEHSIRHHLHRLRRKSAAGLTFAPAGIRRTDIEYAASIADDGASPEEEAIGGTSQHVRTVSLRRALSGLTQRDQAIVVHRANNVPMADIAEDLGMSTKTVRNISSQAFKHLRAVLSHLT